MKISMTLSAIFICMAIASSCMIGCRSMAEDREVGTREQLVELLDRVATVVEDPDQVGMYSTSSLSLTRQAQDNQLVYGIKPSTEAAHTAYILLRKITQYKISPQIITSYDDDRITAFLILALVHADGEFEGMYLSGVKNVLSNYEEKSSSILIMSCLRYLARFGSYSDMQLIQPYLRSDSENVVLMANWSKSILEKYTGVQNGSQYRISEEIESDHPLPPWIH